MKGDITKAYKFCTIITCDDLQRLNKFIASEYCFIKYEIFTVDGAKYKLDNFNEIIENDNPESRKIEKIVIKANKQKEEDINFVYPDFEMQLNDYSKNTYSIIYTIRNESEKEINYYTNRFNELIMNFKSKDSWVNSIWIPWILFSVLWILFCTSINNFLSDKVDKTILFIFLIIISIFFGYVVNWIYTKVVSDLFPKTIFCIGKQNQVFENIKKKRNLIFVGIILTFVVGVLSSFFVLFLTN